MSSNADIPLLICLVLFFYNFILIFNLMWDLSSQTRDGTGTPCSGSSEFQPLDHQGSPPSSSSEVNLGDTDSTHGFISLTLDWASGWSTACSHSRDAANF